MDNTQCLHLKSILTEIIDEEIDSLRFYYLGNKYKTKVEHMGVDKGIAADEILFFGFAFGIAGIASTVLGGMADKYGIEAVYNVCAFMPLLGLVACFLPNLKKR